MVVLGIDAAWTRSEPSGVAVARWSGGRWECVAVAPSYLSFLALAGGATIDWSVKPEGSAPDPAALMNAAALLAGASPVVVAVDMPLATTPISSRRAADDAVSSAYGARGCAVHTPSALRPGPIADAVRSGFEAQGYALACASTRAGEQPRLLEVFPHIALLKLLGASYRVPYKASKIRKYWPAESPANRRDALVAQWARITDALAQNLAGFDLTIPRSGPIAGLKRYEDAIDAVLCAWVGIEYLSGNATALGDDTAAIWT